MQLQTLLARRVALGAALACLLLIAPSCRSSSGGGPQAAYPPLIPGDFGSMNNVSSAGPIWIGGMPTEDDLELAQRRGIARVIDLSVPSEARTYDVASQCRMNGLDYATAGLVDEGRLTSESVDLVLAELKGDEVPPTLMFCGTGSRCAMYFAIYRVTQVDVPLEEALVEARRAGMQAGAPAAFVRSEVKRLAEQALDDQARVAAQ